MTAGDRRIMSSYKVLHPAFGTFASDREGNWSHRRHDLHLACATALREMAARKTAS